MSKRHGFTAERIAFVSLLVAMQIVLGNAVQIHLLQKQFNLGFLPVALAGWLFGPVSAMIVGGLGDFFGAHLFPSGAYVIGFTLSEIAAGLLYGLILYRRRASLPRIAAAVTLVSVFYLFANSYWLSVYYARTFWAWFAMRWWTYFITIPLNASILYYTMRNPAILGSTILAAMGRGGRVFVPEAENAPEHKEEACEAANAPFLRS